MGRNATNAGGSDFKQAPPGTHIARCIKLVDIGTQHSEYQGELISRNQFIASFELPLETMEIDGVQKPLIVSKFYTNSTHEKANWRKDLESWRSKPLTEEEARKFDNNTVLGKPLMLSIVHSEKGKAKIISVSALPKGTVCPPQFNPSSSFWLDEWDEDALSKLPDGIKDMIAKSDEYKAHFKVAAQQLAPQTKHVDDFKDDIPF